jgi:CheY-like chemotaxis protein
VGKGPVFNCENLDRSNNALHSFLIVENDPNDAFLIHRALQKTGHCSTSYVCRNPSEAKDFLRGFGMYSDRSKYPLPDLILTDLRMEAESGIELVEWIRRQNASFSATPIIILTGSASALQFDAAQKVGAQAVHRKPSRLEDLQRLLTNIAAEFCPTPATAFETANQVIRGQGISAFDA